MIPTEAYPPRTFLIEPLAQAERLRFDGWSPDGQWIAFWQSKSEDSPASLTFINIQSGKVCQYDDLASSYWDGRTLWQDSSHVSVVLNQDQNQIILTGFPCNKFEPAEDGTPSERTNEVSPDGRFRADTEHSSEDQILHHVTSIIDISTGEAILQTSWDSSVHSLRSGPGWLNNDLYLIGQTLDQGLLYISVPNRRTGNVFTDLFKMDETLGRNTWHVFSHTDPAAGTYHILFTWDGGPKRLPLLLYHSESNQLEELPFYAASPFQATGYSPLDFFSPDGTWLLVREPINAENSSDDSNADYWLQSIDTPGSRAIQISKNLSPATTSWEAQKIAFSDRDSIYVRSIPNGEWLGHWVSGKWTLTPMAWSPNGERLVAMGYSRYGSEEAIFIIEP